MQKQHRGSGSSGAEGTPAIASHDSYFFFYIALPSVDASPPPPLLSLKLGPTVRLDKLAQRLHSAVPEAVSEWELYWNGVRLDLSLFPSQAGMVPGRSNLIYLQVHYLDVARGRGGGGAGNAALQAELHEALCHLNVLRARVDAHMGQLLEEEAGRRAAEEEVERLRGQAEEVDALIAKYRRMDLG